MGPWDSISYRLMRLKKDFLKIHFSNYACSVARTHPSDMPAKTLEKSVQTNIQTHRESNFLPQTTRVLRTIILYYYTHINRFSTLNRLRNQYCQWISQNTVPHIIWPGPGLAVGWDSRPPWSHLPSRIDVARGGGRSHNSRISIAKKLFKDGTLAYLDHWEIPNKMGKNLMSVDPRFGFFFRIMQSRSAD